jgi:hypothetical protein
MTALASLLSLVIVGLLRVFTRAPGMPCIIGAAATGSVGASRNVASATSAPAEQQSATGSSAGGSRKG